MSEVKVTKFKWLTPDEFTKIKSLTNEYSIQSIASLTKRSYNLVKAVADNDTFEEYKANSVVRNARALKPKAGQALPEPDFEKLGIMQQLQVIEAKVDTLNNLLLAQNDNLKIKKGWLGK